MPKQILCEVCSGEREINSHGYAPPITNHPVIDEAFYSEELGWVCRNCFDKVEWNDEDLQTLRHDWGWELCLNN